MCQTINHHHASLLSIRLAPTQQHFSRMCKLENNWHIDSRQFTCTQPLYSPLFLTTLISVLNVFSHRISSIQVGVHPDYLTTGMAKIGTTYQNGRNWTLERISPEMSSYSPAQFQETGHVNMPLSMHFTVIKNCIYIWNM